MPASTHWVSVYKIGRWVFLLILVVAILVALRRPSPPALPIAPQSAREDLQSFNDKLDKLAQSRAQGEAQDARFTSDEVNSAISHSLEEDASQPAAATTAAAPPVETGAPIRTVQVGFFDDQVTGQFAAELYGKQIYITISGHLGSKDGYVTFDPTAFKVGDLEVPVGWVNPALQRKLSEPDNREKLRLPDYISGLRVENGELVISEK